jgi:hypothetical protein
MHGQVLICDGDPSGDWSSWAIVFAKVPGYTGSATATLLFSDGESRARALIVFQGGDGETWLVTYADLTRFDSLTVTSPTGQVLATAAIEHAQTGPGSEEALQQSGPDANHDPARPADANHRCDPDPRVLHARAGSQGRGRVRGRPRFDRPGHDVRGG